MAETAKTKSASAKSGGDAGQAEVQAIFDEAAEKGYFGTVPDGTPNENYSLETSPDAPTPENTRARPDKQDVK